MSGPKTSPSVPLLCLSASVLPCVARRPRSCQTSSPRRWWQTRGSAARGSWARPAADRRERPGLCHSMPYRCFPDRQRFPATAGRPRCSTAAREGETGGPIFGARRTPRARSGRRQKPRGRSLVAGRPKRHLRRCPCPAAASEGDGAGAPTSLGSPQYPNRHCRRRRLPRLPSRNPYRSASASQPASIGSIGSLAAAFARSDCPCRRGSRPSARPPAPGPRAWRPRTADRTMRPRGQHSNRHRTCDRPGRIRRTASSGPRPPSRCTPRTAPTRASR